MDKLSIYGLLLLLAGCWSAPAVQGQAPLMLASNDDVWAKYKRIRQGKSSIEEEAATSKPASKAPQADAPLNQPEKSTQAVSSDGAGVESSAVPTTPPVSAKSVPSNQAPGPAAARDIAEDADNRFRERADSSVVSAPESPQEQQGDWEYYLGDLAIADTDFYGAYERDFKWAYSLRRPLPQQARILVLMHGSGGGEGAMRVFGPSPRGDIELRNQDAEAYAQRLREWWTYGPEFRPAPGRRIAATLHYLQERYELNLDQRGIVLHGSSMGGAGAVVQTMILPEPWREKIAYSTARVGVVMPRRIYAKHPGQYRYFPPDNGWGTWLWDKIDFEVQAARDPVVRAIHYRHAFGSNDQFSDGPDGSTILEFVNIVERNKIGGAFSWTGKGHSLSEPGYNVPLLWKFEVPEQDVTLDRAHPAITNSTGNHPLTAVDRVDEQRFPRGHYNLGIYWNHAKILDQPDQLVFPLKYFARANFGLDVPDQPTHITVSVTPRRPKHFDLVDGDVVQWSWDGGAVSGTAVVQGDTLTVDNIPLVSGQPYKNLRFYKP